MSDAFTARAVFMAPDPTGTVGPRGVEVRQAVLNLPEARPLNATLTITWTSAQPMDETMDVTLRDSSERLVASGSGASPIVIEVPGDAFEDVVEFFGYAMPPAPGVSGPDVAAEFALMLAYA